MINSGNGVLLRVVIVMATCIAVSPLSGYAETPNTPAAAARHADAPTPAPDLVALLDRARAEVERLRAAKDFAGAIISAAQVMELARQVHGEDTVETAIATHNLAFLLRRAGRDGDAEPYLRRALAVYEQRLPAIHEDTRNAAGELGQILVRTGRAGQLVEIYERLLSRALGQGHAGHVAAAHIHNNLAFVLRGMQRIAAAEQNWVQAVAIYRLRVASIEEPYKLAIDALFQRYSETHRLDAARELVTGAIRGLSSASGPAASRERARLHGMLAGLENVAGDYIASRRHAQAALTAIDPLGTSADIEVVDGLNSLARASRALGEYKDAEAAYRRAILILELHGSKANTGIVLDNLAVLMIAMGRYAEAEPLHKRAIALLEADLGLTHRSVGQAIANLGAYYNITGAHEEAEPLLRRGLEIAQAQKPQDLLQIATFEDNLGGTLALTGRTEEALTRRRAALENFKKVLSPNHPTFAVVHNNLGRTLLDVGDKKGAETSFLKALAVNEAAFGADHINTSRTLVTLAEFLVDEGRRDEAAPLLSRATATIERVLGPGHPSGIYAYAALGRLERAEKRWPEARNAFAKAVRAELAQRDVSSGGRTVSDKLRGRAEREVFAGLLEAMWHAGEVSATESLNVGQWETITPAAAAVAALGARGAGDPALGQLVRERQDLAAEWRARDLRLTELLARATRDVPAETALRGRLEAIRARSAVLDREIAERNPKFSELSRPAPLPLDDIQRLLHPHEAALQFLVADDATHAWLVTRDKAQWVRIPATAREVRTLVGALRCGLDRSEWEGAGAARCAARLGLGDRPAPGAAEPLPFDLARARGLAKILLGPFETAIEDKDLVVVASGPLAQLPFQVLLAAAPVTDARGATDYARQPWLGTRHAITVLPSFAALRSLREGARPSAAAAPFVGIGNPLLTGADGQDRSAFRQTVCSTEPSALKPAATLASTEALLGKLMRGGAVGMEDLRRQPPLPETADELCMVARFLGAPADAVQLGAMASEANVKALSENQTLTSARVVHFATHGLVAGETQQFIAKGAEPALLLTPPEKASEADDGLLTASEVATLKLDADWVVLSACNTAAGDATGAEALSGLARSFFYAGARALLVSHWAVESQATVRLVTGTFASLSEARVGKAEALRRAISGMVVAGGPTSHPSAWAPFVVVGEGGSANRPAIVPVAAPITNALPEPSRDAAPKPAAAARSVAPRPSTAVPVREKRKPAPQAVEDWTKSILRP
jgi:CHAT domain-containing protein/tetratricopeptide (TPR) repeat protein